MSDAKKDPPPLAAQLTKGIDSVDLHEFAGGIAQEMATLPQIRVGKKWYTTAQILTVLIPLGFVAGLCVVAFAQQIRTIPQVQAFIQEYKLEEKDISPYFWPQGKEPDSEEYRAHLAQQFQNYKLKVGGLVENPVDFFQSDNRWLKTPRFGGTNPTNKRKAPSLAKLPIVSASSRHASRFESTF